MNIRGHGSAVAIALAGLAVVIAGTGATYAVTATTVNIADPVTPSRVAKVDAAGRLSTVGAVTSLNIASYGYTSSGSGDVFSAPTTATLAVGKFSVIGVQAPTATYDVYLFQVPVQSDGTCSPTLTTRLLGVAQVAPGSIGGQDYTVPLQVKPVAGAKYCLDVFLKNIAGTPGPSDTFAVQVNGYVVSGNYSGVGTTAGPATADLKGALG